MFGKTEIAQPVATIGDGAPTNMGAPEGSLHYDRKTLCLWAKESHAWQLIGGIALIPTPLYNENRNPLGGIKGNLTAEAGAGYNTKW